jgi:hypothetical protein
VAQGDARARTAQANQAYEAQVLQVANATTLGSGSGTLFKKIDHTAGNSHYLAESLDTDGS